MYTCQTKHSPKHSAETCSSTIVRAEESHTLLFTCVAHRERK